MKKVGIFYGSTTGNTQGVAEQIQAIFGEDNADIMEVSGAKSADLEGYENLILGCSTWGIGDMQDDFDDFLPELQGANLEGKKVALFGCGDQESYADSFVDAMGEIYATVKDKGCQLVGSVPTEGYEYDESRAVVDGNFVGLPIDEDNQSDLSSSRINQWVGDLKNNFGL
ncbi:MAG: flavodoxin [Bacteroidetes bacterium]|nr:MAG: flavodoxin [Bacteroidota bacterium]PIE88347.1 MAG: flavodoxin [Bacteroidota bacterium]